MIEKSGEKASRLALNDVDLLDLGSEPLERNHPARDREQNHEPLENAKVNA